MAILETRTDPTAPEFGANRERMEALVSELRERTAEAARGGGDEAVEKHRSRGKLLARERVDRLRELASSS